MKKLYVRTLILSLALASYHALASDLSTSAADDISNKLRDSMESLAEYLQSLTLSKETNISNKLREDSMESLEEYLQSLTLSKETNISNKLRDSMESLAEYLEKVWKTTEDRESFVQCIKNTKSENFEYIESGGLALVFKTKIKSSKYSIFQIAIKIPFHKNQNLYKKLENEEKILKKICSFENSDCFVNQIISQYCLFDQNSQLAYLALEYAEYGDSYQFFMEYPHLAYLDEVRKNLLGMFDFLNSNGILHRDIKPENILVYLANGQIILKLTDFDSAIESSDLQKAKEEVFTEIKSSVRKHCNNKDFNNLVKYLEFLGLSGQIAYYIESSYHVLKMDMDSFTNKYGHILKMTEDICGIDLTVGTQTFRNHEVKNKLFFLYDSRIDLFSIGITLFDYITCFEDNDIRHNFYCLDKKTLREELMNFRTANGQEIPVAAIDFLDCALSKKYGDSLEDLKDLAESTH